MFSTLREPTKVKKQYSMNHLGIKIKPKMVLSLNRFVTGVGKIERIDDKSYNDSMSISMNYFDFL